MNYNHKERETTGMMYHSCHNYLQRYTIIAEYFLNCKNTDAEIIYILNSFRSTNLITTFQD